jgi:hypothetical protein
MSQPAALALSRRNFLKAGSLGGVLLATGSATALLTGCASPQPASGHAFLREQDIRVVRALIPVVLAGALPTGAAAAAAVDKVLKSLDGFIGTTSPGVMAPLYQLFDLLSLPPARIALARLWDDWPDASAEDLEAFLLRWRDSSIGMFRAGYAGLVKIITTSWYLLPESWPATGYEAPVRRI